MYQHLEPGSTWHEVQKNGQMLHPMARVRSIDPWVHDFFRPLCNLPYQDLEHADFSDIN